MNNKYIVNRFAANKLEMFAGHKDMSETAIRWKILHRYFYIKEH